MEQCHSPTEQSHPIVIEPSYLMMLIDRVAPKLELDPDWSIRDTMEHNAALLERLSKTNECEQLAGSELAVAKIFSDCVRLGHAETAKAAKSFIESEAKRICDSSMRPTFDDIGMRTPEA